MSDSEIVDDRLARWRALKDAGAEPALEELCGDRPDLLPALRESLDVRRWLEGGLPDATTSDAQPLNSTAPSTDATDQPTDRNSPRAQPPLTTTVPRFDAPPAFLRPPESADELGRLADYRMLRRLDGGGMGDVFEAEHLTLRRRVAVKVIKPAAADSPTSRERFLREARALARVEHDHVCPVYDAGEANGALYLTMPLLAGESLAKRLERGPLPAAEVLRVGRQAAEGLAAAHARGLIHRDVKPANLWLEAPTGRVRVLDFGLVRAADADLGGERTAAGALMGTLGYMAPEQADGPDVDARADLFSLGCVLYRAATGRQAFAGKSMAAVLRATAELHPPMAHHLDPAVPEALSQLIQCLLEKRPEDRPSSAAEVAARLQAMELDPPAPRPRAADSSAPTVTATLLAKPAPRRRFGRATAFVSAGLLALSLALGAYGWFVGGWWRGERPDRSPPAVANDAADKAKRTLVAEASALPKSPRAAAFAGTPAGNLFDVLENGPFPEGDGKELDLSLALEARGSADRFVTVADDDTVEPGSAYRLLAAPSARGYLYVVQTDSFGNVAWVYPENPVAGAAKSFGTNPVPGIDSLSNAPAFRTLAKQIVGLTNGQSVSVGAFAGVSASDRWPGFGTDLAAALEQCRTGCVKPKAAFELMGRFQLAKAPDGGRSLKVRLSMVDTETAETVIELGKELALGTEPALAIPPRCSSLVGPAANPNDGSGGLRNAPAFRALAEEVLDVAGDQPMTVAAFTGAALPEANAAPGIEGELVAALQRRRPHCVKAGARLEVRGDCVFVKANGADAKMKIRIRVFDKAAKLELAELRGEIGLGLELPLTRLPRGRGAGTRREQFHRLAEEVLKATAREPVTVGVFSGIGPPNAARDTAAALERELAGGLLAVQDASVKRNAPYEVKGDFSFPGAGKGTQDLSLVRLKIRLIDTETGEDKIQFPLDVDFADAAADGIPLGDRAGHNIPLGDRAGHKSLIVVFAPRPWPELEQALRDSAADAFPSGDAFGIDHVALAGPAAETSAAARGDRGIVSLPGGTRYRTKGSVLIAEKRFRLLDDPKR